MASIRNAKIEISRDTKKQIATPVVTCDIYFTDLELCMMKTCSSSNMFKLKCKLMGKDFWSADDYLYTYSTVHWFPDPSPTSPESRRFEVTLGYGVLDEDSGKDEIYGKLTLYNLFAGTSKSKRTNVVHHYF